jgi:hypothetical protein
MHKPLIFCCLFPLLLVAGLAQADTMIRAGNDPKNPTNRNLVFGHTEVEVTFRDLRTGEDHKSPAVLAGAIRGKLVVIPFNDFPGVHFEPCSEMLKRKPYCYNALYMVEVTDGTAEPVQVLHNGLVSNVIPVQMPDKRNLSEYLYDAMPAEVLRNQRANNRHQKYGGPIARVLEVPAPGTQDQARLLFVNGSASLYQLDLIETRDNGLGMQLLRAEFNAERPPQQEPAIARWINLDLIDLNPLVASTEKLAPIPTAIAIWYQRSGKHWEQPNYWAQANSLALASGSGAGALSVYQRLEHHDDEDRWLWGNQAPTAWDMRSGSYTAPAISGGALVMPDENGNLSYWFSRTWYETKYAYIPAQYGWEWTFFPIWWMQTYRLDFVFDRQMGRLTFRSPDPTHASTFRWRADSSKAGDENLWRHRYLRGWYGPTVRTGDKDKPEERGLVYLDNLVKDPPGSSKPEWTRDSRPIGTLTRKPVKAVEAIGLSEYDGAKDLTPLQEKARDYIHAGRTLQMVLYGWPYFPLTVAPEQGNTPAFVRGRKEQTIVWARSHFGKGFDLELGFQGGMKELFKVSQTVIGGLSYQAGSERNQSTTQETALTLDWKSDTRREQFELQGYVVWQDIKPTITEFGLLKPKNAEKIKLAGLPSYEFAFFVGVVGFQNQEEISLESDSFDLTNPEADFSDDGRMRPRPLSAGLAPRVVNGRPIASALTPANYEAVSADIAEWERQVQLDDLIALSTGKRGEVTGVTQVRRERYKLSEKKALQFADEVSVGSTEQWEWYAGAHFKFESELVGPMIDLTAKLSGGSETGETKDSGESWSLAVPGTDSKTGFADKRFEIIALRIEIPLLKSYIARTAQSGPFKGKPALVPDWAWKYNQNFVLLVTRLSKVQVDQAEVLVDALHFPSADLSLTAPGWDLQALDGIPVPAGRLGEFYLPIRLLDGHATRGAGIPLGGVAHFVLHADGRLPVTGFWARSTKGQWANIATSVTREDGRWRIAFAIKDGGPYDADGLVNGEVRFVGGPGWLPPRDASHARGFDHDADGHADIVLLDDTTGEVWLLLMRHGKYIGKQLLAEVAPQPAFAAMGRFADGAALLVQEQGEADLYRGLLTGQAIDQLVTIGAIEPAWTPVLLADLDGDGNADLLLQGDADGALRALYLDADAQVIADAVLGALTEGQAVAFAADLTGDGRAELILLDAASALTADADADADTDANSGLLMPDAGAGLVQMAQVGANGLDITDVMALPDGWELLGRGVFNHDETTDLVLRDRLTGEVWLYLMNGAEVLEETAIANWPADAVEVLQIADFDGDGLSDILWLDTADQMMQVTLMAPNAVRKTFPLFELNAGWGVVTELGER